MMCTRCADLTNHRSKCASRRGTAKSAGSPDHRAARCTSCTNRKHETKPPSGTNLTIESLHGMASGHALRGCAQTKTVALERPRRDASLGAYTISLCQKNRVEQCPVGRVKLRAVRYIYISASWVLLCQLLKVDLGVGLL